MCEDDIVIVSDARAENTPPFDPMIGNFHLRFATRCWIYRRTDLDILRSQPLPDSASRITNLAPATFSQRFPVPFGPVLAFNDTAQVFSDFEAQSVRRVTGGVGNFRYQVSMKGRPYDFALPVALSDPESNVQ